MIGMSIGHVHFEMEKVLYVKRTVINADLSLNRERDIFWLLWLMKNGRKLVVHITGGE